MNTDAVSLFFILIFTTIHVLLFITAKTKIGMVCKTVKVAAKSFEWITTIVVSEEQKQSRSNNMGSSFSVIGLEFWWGSTITAW